MFIQCQNSDIFWCLLYDGYAICSPEESIIAIDIPEDKREELVNSFLDKYKVVFCFDIVEYTKPLKEAPRYLTQYNPRWIYGMVAKKLYNKYFK